MDYKELLKDGRWQMKKSAIMLRDGYTCRVCGAKASDGVTLNVHHLHYKRGAAPWEYDNDELITLCESCHKQTHDNMKSVLYDLKIGDFVRYSHGDYDNFGIVYDIDFKSMTGKIATIDIGGGYTNLYLGVIRIDEKGNITTYNDYDVTRDKAGCIEDENTPEEYCSYGGYFYGCLADCLVHLGEYRFEFTADLDEQEELSLLKTNLSKILENNEELKTYFKHHDY